MTLDSAGRSAAAALHQAIRQDLEVHAMLDQLQHDSRRTKSIEVAALIGAAALLVALGWVYLGPGDEATTIPGGTVFGASATAVDLAACGGVQDPCAAVAAGSYLLPLEVPFTATLPAGVDIKGQIESTDRGRVALDVDVVSSTGAGLSVVMDPEGSKPVEGRNPDPTAGTTAESMATWLASQAYLDPTAAVTTTVSGLPAWQVDVRLRDDAPATSTCQPSIGECIPMVLLPFGTNATGIAHGQVGRMIFVQAAADRVIWVYSWDGGGDSANDLNAVLALTQPIIDSIEFDTTGL